MSLNLSSQLGRSIAPPDEAAPRAQSAGLASYHFINFFSLNGTAADTRPVLQLNALPMTLRPADYANAHSGSNPGGSFTALYSLSSLADAVPCLAEYYSASLNTVSSVYDSLVHGASVKADAPYASAVLARAVKNFDSAEFSNMDGIPGQWYPVYATPADWYNTSDPSRFSDISLDLSGKDQDDSGPYRIIKGTQSAAGQMINTSNGATAPVDPATALKTVNFRYLEVQLSRPWLNFEVFNMGGWYVGGQTVGYFSDGCLDNNDGVMPLITTSMLVAINVGVEADWSAKDQQRIDVATSQGNGIAVGPFTINAAPSELHVIGWISRLVPLAPQITAG